MGRVLEIFQLKKKKKACQIYYNFSFFLFFFPSLSSKLRACLNFLHGEKFIASQLARLLDTIYRFPFPDRA